MRRNSENTAPQFTNDPEQQKIYQPYSGPAIRMAETTNFNQEIKKALGCESSGRCTPDQRDQSSSPARQGRRNIQLKAKAEPDQGGFNIQLYATKVGQSDPVTAGVNSQQLLAIKGAQNITNLNATQTTRFMKYRFGQTQECSPSNTKKISIQVNNNYSFDFRDYTPKVPQLPSVKDPSQTQIISRKQLPQANYQQGNRTSKNIHRKQMSLNLIPCTQLENDISHASLLQIGQGEKRHASQIITKP